jgi:hypothetical protein
VNAILEPPRTPLDLNFRLLHTHIRVSVWFWIIPVVLGSLFVVFGGIIYLLLTVLCFFLSVLLHELGHVTAGRWFGQDCYVVLNPLGGVAIGCAGAFERWQRVVVYAAGPAIQMLLAGIVWEAERVLTQHHPSLELEYPLISFVLRAMLWINLCMGLMNLLPLGPPLDGWYICREMGGFLLGASHALWEADANWWKAGGRWEHPTKLGPDLYSPKSNILPLTILIGAAGLAIGWHTLRDYKIATATDLVREFKNDPEGAMQKYGHRRLTFTGILKRPNWEGALYQYEGGYNAMVYFATNDPEGWLFCIVPHDNSLRELKEGARYCVSGKIYHYDEAGGVSNLFLQRCSVKLLE